MEKTRFPDDFKEFLKLLEENEVRYLLIGGYAVSIHGYARTTLDMDIWIGMDDENARRMVDVMASFGFSRDELNPEIFLDERCLIRMGLPPLRLEVLTMIDGIEFSPAYERRVEPRVDDLRIKVISLEDLRTNKKASGRNKDLADLDHLPGARDAST